MPNPADERPRRSTDRYGFEFWSPQGSFGGHISLWRWPDRNVAWYSTAIFGAATTVVALCDELPLSRTGTLELRGNGLWADHNLEEPFVHWSVGLEAFALALEHPSDQRGERVPLGYDLEWHCDRTVSQTLDDGYEQPAQVSGEVLVGADSYELDGFGWRFHVGNSATGRRRRGLRHGQPRWTHPDPTVKPGDDAAGWSWSVTPAGTLHAGLFRSEDGTVGVVEDVGPPA